MADEQTTPEEIKPETETETPIAEPEAPVAAEPPVVPEATLPGIEPEADKPAEEAVPEAEEPKEDEKEEEPKEEPEADKPEEEEKEEPAPEADKPATEAPKPELVGDVGGSSDAPAGDMEVKTEGGEPTTQEDMGQTIEVVCVGEPLLILGNANKQLKVGEDHQAVGIDNQVLAAASASVAARGVQWEAFCQVAGILGGTAFDLHRHVKKNHAGASKTESEWQAVVDMFLRESAS